jgi:LAO/AO transport system kinase
MEVEKIIQGNRLALARLITQIENQEQAGLAVLDQLFPFTGKAHLVGITGSPGSGKSSLINHLVKQYLRSDTSQSQRVAVVAVDPTSPFSGGALLGDRVRMRDLMSEPRVFIRSMASRGAMGGLARTTGLVTQALDAAGYGTILIETVGAGQTEVEIARLAHTVIVVEAPGMGDDIQAIKAGILEIADILVVNKSDHSGAGNTVRALRNMLELARPEILAADHPSLPSIEGDEIADDPKMWVTPVVQTIATQGDGVDQLLGEIENHKSFLVDQNRRQQIDRFRLVNELNRELQSQLFARWKEVTGQAMFDRVLLALEKREITPQAAILWLLGNQTNGNDLTLSP